MYFVKPEESTHFGEVRMRNSIGKTRTYKAVSVWEYQLYKKIQNGYSPLLVISGERGIGKSTLALKICEDYCQFMHGKSFDFKKYSFYETTDVIKKIGEMRNMPLLIDEAGEFVDYLDWYKKTAKALRSMINTQRFRGLVYVFISPFVIEIMKNIRKHFHFKLIITAKGRYKAFKYMKKFGAEEQKKASYPLFLDDMGYKTSDLPKGIYEKYRIFSEREKELIRKKWEMEIEGDADPRILNMINSFCKISRYFPTP